MFFWSVRLSGFFGFSCLVNRIVGHVTATLRLRMHSEMARFPIVHLAQFVVAVPVVSCRRWRLNHAVAWSNRKARISRGTIGKGRLGPDEHSVTVKINRNFSSIRNEVMDSVMVRADEYRALARGRMP
jgi:hypothetical protein